MCAITKHDNGRSEDQYRGQIKNYRDRTRYRFFHSWIPIILAVRNGKQNGENGPSARRRIYLK